MDLRLLGACNLRCPFCFGPRHHIGPQQLEKIIALLPRLHAHGVRTIVVTGGEPLLVRGLPRLLADAKTLGLRVILSTNGTKVAQRHTEILPLLDWIALPLDGPAAAVHDAARPGAGPSFEAVLDAIALVRKHYPAVGVKLGTVVTAQNAASVSSIPAVLPSALRPDVWKLYEVSFSSYASDNRDALELSPARFEHTVARARARAHGAGWSTVVYRNAERNGKYLFIEPDGSAMVIAGGAERSIGNLLTGFDGVLDAWAANVDIARLVENVELTYPRGLHIAA